MGRALAFMQSDRHEDAFAHYVEGNAARKEELERLEKYYEPEKFERRVDRLIECFDRERCAGPGGSSSELPIIIVGMPRVARTLHSQSICS